MLMLVSELYGVPIEPDVSRSAREMAADYMAAHFERLAAFLDRLSQHSGESIDELAQTVHRRWGTPEEISVAAVTVLGWHGIFAPYHKKQTPFVASDRLMREIRKSANALHTYAVYVIGGMDAPLYNELKLLDEKMAEDFFKYSLMFGYENIANADVQSNLKMEPDHAITIPNLHDLFQAAPAGSLRTNAGD